MKTMLFEGTRELRECLGIPTLTAEVEVIDGWTHVTCNPPFFRRYVPLCGVGRNEGDAIQEICDAVTRNRIKENWRMVVRAYFRRDYVHTIVFIIQQLRKKSPTLQTYPVRDALNKLEDALEYELTPTGYRSQLSEKRILDAEVEVERLAALLVTESHAGLKSDS